MPLSKSSPRHHVHTREIRCYGYKRDDGLWDIEGSITDTKPYPVENKDRDGINAGEPIHSMDIRLTIDDDMVIQEAEATTNAAPFNVCDAITPTYAALKGLRVGAGWRRAIAERLGGVRGCTHITDLLLGPLAVTAYQTLRAVRFKQYAERASGERPPQLNSCHTFASDGAITKERWPEFYSGN